VLAVATITAPDSDAQQTLFTNVRVWDGTSDSLTEATNVLIVNNLIHSIGSDVSSDNATVIDAAPRGDVLIEGPLLRPISVVRRHYSGVFRR
jgi:hypothetical protein